MIQTGLILVAAVLFVGGVQSLLGKGDDPRTERSAYGVAIYSFIVATLLVVVAWRLPELLAR